MSEYDIIVGLKATVKAETQIKAIKEFLDLLPNCVQEIRFDSIRECPWQEIEEEDEEP
jgi:hypothetical protein